MPSGLIVFGIFAPLGRRCASSTCTRFAKIVPNSATPIEPPICRNIVEPLVATPITDRSTAFCTARTSTCMTMPSPRPSTTAKPAVTHTLVPTSSRESRAMPTATSAVPTIGKTR